MVPAASLQIEVLPAARPPRARPTWVVRPPVPFTQGFVRVDGSFADSTWVGAPITAPLEPTPTGPTPPDARIMASVSEAGLHVAVPTVSGVARVTLDPDGLNQAWWTAELRDGTTTWQRCSFDGVTAPHGGRAPTRAAPCTSIDAMPNATGVDGTELTFRWDRMQPASSMARLIWSVDGPTPGTWMARGAAVPMRPELGSPLKAGPPLARVLLETDVGAGLWRATITPRRDTPDRPLAWSAWWMGHQVGAGEVVPDDNGALEVSGPLGTLDGLALEVRDPSDTGPLPRATRAFLAPPRGSISLATPVHDGVIEVAWTLSNPEEVQLEVVAAGALLATATGELPAGTGILRVEANPRWPRVVTLRMAPLGEVTTWRR